MLDVIVIVSGEVAQVYTNKLKEIFYVKLETAVIWPVIVIVKVPICVAD